MQLQAEIWEKHKNEQKYSEKSCLNHNLYIALRTEA